MKNTPLFIVGAPRSGTSLVRDLVKFIDGVYLPPDELQIIRPFVQICERGASSEELVGFLENTVFASHMKRRKIWPSRANLLAQVESISPSNSLRQLVLNIASKEGVESPRYWGDKTPENIFIIDLIRQLWPDAKILYVIRDPRSTVFSMKRSWGRSFTRGAVVWRDGARAALAAKKELGKSEFYALYYESLITNPKQQLSALANWLGMSFDASQLDAYQSEERWGQASGAQGVFRNKYSWEDFLTVSQVALIEKITYGEMKSLGYRPIYATEVLIPNALKLKLVTLLDGFRSICSYAKERGIRKALLYKLNQWRVSRYS